MGEERESGESQQEEERDSVEGVGEVEGIMHAGAGLGEVACLAANVENKEIVLSTATPTHRPCASKPPPGPARLPELAEIHRRGLYSACSCADVEADKLGRQSS